MLLSERHLFDIEPYWINMNSNQLIQLFNLVGILELTHGGPFPYGLSLVFIFFSHKKHFFLLINYLVIISLIRKNNHPKITMCMELLLPRSQNCEEITNFN